MADQKQLQLEAPTKKKEKETAAPYIVQAGLKRSSHLGHPNYWDYRHESQCLDCHWFLNIKLIFMARINLTWSWIKTQTLLKNVQILQDTDMPVPQLWWRNQLSLLAEILFMKSGAPRRIDMRKICIFIKGNVWCNYKL